MRLALALLALGAASCGAGDRITLEFDQEATRTEAIAVDVYALQLKTRAGAEIDCAGLLAQTRRPDDGSVVVAQQTTVPLPVPPGPHPLLVRLPQQRFIFFAVARDRFGFEVARGCRVDDVTSRRALDLAVTLVTVAAPGGTLVAEAPVRWLQHAGPDGVGAAPRATVRTLDEHGQPRAGIEVRALIESGDAVPLTTRGAGADDAEDASRLISDETGRAATALLVGVGPARLLLHARGLANSPVAFDLTGLASPVLDDVSFRIPAQPVAVFAGNYDYDAHSAPDLLIALRDASGTYCTYWRGAADGSGFSAARHVSLDPRSALVAGGHFDLDNRSDLALAVLTPPALITIHHDDTLGDSLQNPRAEPLPADVQTIERLLPVRVDGDDQDDLVLRVRADDRLQILLYVSLPLESTESGRSLSLVQRFGLPDFAGVPELAATDVDGDGDDELLLLNPLLGIWVVPSGVDEFGTGHGSFFVPARPTPSTWLHFFPNAGNSFASSVDVDGDNWRDLVVLSDGSLLGAPASLQIAHGNGTLRGLALDDPREVALTQIAAAAFVDLNADGHVDVLALTNSPPQRALLMGGDGSGQFAAPLVLPVGMGTLALAVADVNIDGTADLGFLGSTSDATYLLMKLSR